MATVVAPPVSAMRDEHVMDTRTPSPSPVRGSANGSDAPSTSADEAYQPDLSNEVAMLSTKLINAINYQTNLDDTLQQTRHELDRSREELRRAKAEKQSLDDAITSGVLIKKSEVDKTMADLRAELAKEKANRESAEKAKRQTEGELQDLTSSLFEEANNMVAEARRDTETAEKRTAQVRSQLSDTEIILASQQEQLQDLKLTMEKLERVDTNARESSVPSTPINPSTAGFDALQHSPTAGGMPVDIPPNHPLHFTQLIAPILRTDVAAYTDFAELLSWARRAAPHSRNASGQISSASQTNLSSINTSAASMSSPNLPGSFSSFSANNSPQSSTFNSGTYTLIPPLKESKFYKRALLEDIEPTLRLDLAPGLSFLSRRTVNSALLNGVLAVEPFASPNAKYYSPIFACALCGESRKQELYARRHRFRTSESEDAQRYPLCEYCLYRIRATADYVGFLRMVRDGLVRCGNEDEEKSAWEEAVRLRERMFWARLGGGVVPAGLRRASVPEPSSTIAVKSEGRRSLDSVPEDGEDGEAGLGLQEAESAEASPEASLAADTIVEDDQEDTLTRTRSELEKRLSRRMSTAQSTATAPLPPTSETESQQDQIDADAQLRREESDITEKMVTPPETPYVEAPTPDVEEPRPVPGVAEKIGTPPVESVSAFAERPPHPRTSSNASSSSQRNPSPSKRPTAGMEERRPSSASSVLARVRAMEAKSK